MYNRELTALEGQTMQFWRASQAARRSARSRRRDDDVRLDVEEVASWALYPESRRLRQSVIGTLRCVLKAPNPISRLTAAAMLYDLGDLPRNPDT